MYAEYIKYILYCIFKKLDKILYRLTKFKDLREKNKHERKQDKKKQNKKRK